MSLDIAAVDLWREKIAARPDECWGVAADWLDDRGMGQWAGELRAITDRTRAVRWWDTRLGRYSLARNPEMERSAKRFWAVTPEWIASLPLNVDSRDFDGPGRVRFAGPVKEVSWETRRVRVMSPFVDDHAIWTEDVELVPYQCSFSAMSSCRSAILWFRIVTRMAVSHGMAYVAKPSLDDIYVYEEDLSMGFDGLSRTSLEQWHWSDFPRELFGPYFTTPGEKT